MKRRILFLSLILSGLAYLHHFLPAQTTPSAPQTRPAAAAPGAVTESASTVEFKSMDSKILGQPLNFSIYLPASYAAGGQKYRVIYFLHGLFENEKRWAERGGKEILDRLIAEKKLGEIVLAIPDGGRSFYTNYYDGTRKYENALLEEFIPYVETHYRIRPGTDSRALSGSSMGGYGALKIGMKHPEMFDSVTAHSAVLVPRFPEEIQPGTRQARYLQILEGPFGKPFNRDYWESENPLRLAENPEKFHDLKLYFDCGDRDRFGFEEGARELHRVLEEKGFKHEFAILPGDHGWEFLKQHMDRSLAFHWKHFGD